MRAVLLHGNDGGLIRERANLLVQAVAGTLTDPFRVSEISRQDGGRLEEEARAQSLSGGRRAVRVRDAGDWAAPIVETALSGPTAGLLILEAGELTPRSRLRLLAEKDSAWASDACHAGDAEAVRARVAGALDAAGVAGDADAMEWLGQHLVGDHATMRGEIEKLLLYAGGRGRIDLAAAMACVGDPTDAPMDEALFAATAGDVEAADAAVTRALSDGAKAVAVVRAMHGHVDRLVRACTLREQGMSAAEAAKGMRPPVFFRRLPAFTRALELWSRERLEAIQAALHDVELACKQTGSPADTLVHHAILTIARRGASLRRR